MILKRKKKPVIRLIRSNNKYRQIDQMIRWTAEFTNLIIALKELRELEKYPNGCIIVGNSHNRERVLNESEINSMKQFNKCKNIKIKIPKLRGKEFIDNLGNKT